MRDDIKKRIEAVRYGELPDGFRKEKNIGIGPKDWRAGTISDVVHSEQRPVPRPTEPYWRLGIRSWAKGTFHSYVDDPTTVDMDELYEVKENDLIVNITFAWEHAIAVAGKEDDGLLVSHRFPTYVFDNENDPAYYRAVISQSFFKDMLDNISPGGAGRNRVLNRKDFLQLPCYIPPVAEQHKIAEILSTCDRVIELKQNLVDELQSLKKTCLAKMFPREGSDVPEVRFPGFTAPWEQQKLGELVQFSKGTGYSKSDLRESGTPIVLYGRLYTNYETVIADVDTYAEAKTGSVYSRGGEVVVPASGESADEISRASVVEQAGVLLGVDLNILFPPADLDPAFLAISISNGKPHDDMARMAQGKSVVHLHNTDLEKIDLLYPVRAEQARIRSFFERIDTLITLHQRDLEAVQQKKKALMQLLLTGLVRVNT